MNPNYSMLANLGEKTMRKNCDNCLYGIMSYAVEPCLGCRNFNKWESKVEEKKEPKKMVKKTLKVWLSKDGSKFALDGTSFVTMLSHIETTQFTVPVKLIIKVEE